jgi:hypothetical protein
MKNPLLWIVLAAAAWWYWQNMEVEPGLKRKDVMS